MGIVCFSNEFKILRFPGRSGEVKVEPSFGYKLREKSSQGRGKIYHNPCQVRFADILTGLNNVPMLLHCRMKPPKESA